MYFLSKWWLFCIYEYGNFMLDGCKKGYIDIEIIICYCFVDYRDFFFKIWNIEIIYVKYCMFIKIFYIIFLRVLDDG